MRDVDLAVTHEGALHVVDAHPAGPAVVLDAGEAGQVGELEAAIGHGALDIVELRRGRPGLGQVPTVWLVCDGSAIRCHHDGGERGTRRQAATHDGAHLKHLSPRTGAGRGPGPR